MAMELPASWKSYLIAALGALVIVGAPWAWRHRPRRRPKGLPKPVKEDPYRLWPRYDPVIRRVMDGRRRTFRKAVTLRRGLPKSKRHRRVERIVTKACQYMGLREATPKDKAQVVRAVEMASDARGGVYFWWHRCYEATSRVRRSSIPNYLRARAEEFEETAAWIEQTAGRTDACGRLLEAMMAECDRLVIEQLRWFSKSAKKRRMLPFWNPKAALWDQPEGMGNYLREAVLLYAIWTRPDKQLETDLDALGEHFGVPFTKLDAACALARAGNTYPARRMFRAAAPARPKREKDFAAYVRMARCFAQGYGKDMRSAKWVLDRMADLAPSSAKAAALSAAGECYAGLGDVPHAVQQFRQAWRLAPRSEAGFHAALRGAELEAFKLDAAQAALQRLEELVSDAPNEERKQEAQWLLLRVYSRLGRKDDLNRLADALADAQPTTPDGARRVLSAAAALYRAGANNQAKQLLSTRMEALEQAGQSGQARLLLGLAELAMWENEAAREQFRQVVSGTSKSLAARAQYLIGYSFLMTQQYASALKGFQTLVERYPDSLWAKEAKRQFLPGLQRFVSGKRDGAGNEKKATQVR